MYIVCIAEFLYAEGEWAGWWGLERTCLQEEYTSVGILATGFRQQIQQMVRVLLYAGLSNCI
jgi:hypothetical protein